MDDLKKLAIDCKFENLHDYFIRDQLVMHNNNSPIQERLWVNGEAPLEDVLFIMRKAEMSGRCATVIKESGKDSDGVFKVSNPNRNPYQQTRGRGHFLPSRGMMKDRKPEERRCYRCNSKEHLAYSRYCPAIRKKCSICGLMGHFSKMCRRGGKVKYVWEGDETTEENIDNEFSHDFDSQATLC